MGLIFATRSVETTKRILPVIINNDISAAKAEREMTQDSYDGSFAASRYYGDLHLLEWKGKTEKKRETQVSDYLEDKSDYMSRLENIIEAVAWNSLGYVAYKLGFIKSDEFDRISQDDGPLFISRHYGTNIKEFSNKKYFLNWIKNASQGELLDFYDARIVDKEGINLGKIDMLEKRIYKAKPKNLPQKYSTIEELYEIVYYGACAF